MRALILFFSVLLLACYCHADCPSYLNCGNCINEGNQTCVWCSASKSCTNTVQTCVGNIIGNLSACPCSDLWRQKACNNCIDGTNNCVWCESGGCYESTDTITCHRYSTCPLPAFTDVEIAVLIVAASLVGISLLTIIAYSLFCKNQPEEVPANECEEEEDSLSHLKHGTLRGAGSINDDQESIN